MLELSVQASVCVWESVRGCISGMGRLDFIHVTQLAKVKFYMKIVKSTV